MNTSKQMGFILTGLDSISLRTLALSNSIMAGSFTAEAATAGFGVAVVDGGIGLSLSCFDVDFGVCDLGLGVRPRAFGVDDFCADDGTATAAMACG